MLMQMSKTDFSRRGGFFGAVLPLISKKGQNPIDNAESIWYTVLSDKTIFKPVRRYRQDHAAQTFGSGASFSPRRGVFWCTMDIAIFRHEKYSDFTPAPDGELLKFIRFIDGHEYIVFPGFCDVHVHLREPGFSYKETIKSGTLAAAHGGFTAVCAMPNLSPVPDSAENLAPELSAIRRDAAVSVYPYGSITVGERGDALSDMDALAPDVVAFSDDGHGVQSGEIMLAAMEKAAGLHKIIAAHCEVNSLLHGGYIHDGEYARAHGHRGISSESEWREVERDIALSERTGCALHICHISTKESTSLIREAKRRGVDVTCETAPHYLLLDEGDLFEDGRFRMNPPLRSREDREALIAGVVDGTIDMIATDHAPHSADEKSRGLSGSAFGVVGLETSFAACYTALVKTGVITLARLVELMAVSPRIRFGIPYCPDEYTAFDLSDERAVDEREFLSLGRSTPFSGRRFFGRCVLTARGGRAVYKEIT